MFSLGFFEIIILLAIALIVLGPKKLPAAARELARFFHQLRAVKDDTAEKLSLSKDFEKLSDGESVRKKNTPPSEERKNTLLKSEPSLSKKK